MSGYSGMILTTAGLNLQAQAQIGGELIITKIAVGDGLLSDSESYDALTALKNQVMTLGVQDLAVTGDGQSRIRALISNTNLTAGFFVREIGVFAKIGESGTETLYSYTNAGTQADYMPLPSVNAVEEVIEIYIVVGNAQNVTANITDSVTLATKKDITEHKTATTLDHPDSSVTDAKIGNRTITDTTTAASGAGLLTNLLSKLGNMIKQITGKSNWYTAPATTLEAANTHITATSGAHTASAISSVATGDVAATNVQAAIDELASEKAALSGAKFTGSIGIGLTPISPLHVGAGTASAAGVINWNARLSTLVSGSAAYTGIGAGLYLDSITNNSLSQPVAGIASYLVGGGSGGGSATDYSGALSFYSKTDTETSPSAKMWLRPSGYLGVGTVSPLSILHVYGSELTVQRKSEALHSAIAFRPLSATLSSSNKMWESGLFASTNDFSIWSYDGTNTGRVFNISSSTGYVGINTSSPSYAFDVVGSINASAGLYINGAAVSTITASGTAPLYACRAWVTFDGSATTPTISASGNISSIVKNSTGNYTINFTTAMPSADYAAFGSIVNTYYTDWFFHPSTKTVTSFTCNFTHGSSAGDGVINLAIFC